MWSPSAPDWVNVDFMRKVLRHSENDESIEVTKLVAVPAVAKGDNYGSVMIRCSVEYSQSCAKTTKKISLIVKIAPMIEGSHKKLMESIKAFDTEIKMMTTTLKMMNEILNDDESRLCARSLYTETGDPSILVLEDLSPLGYRMADRRMGLDLEHCLLTLRGLAKFHASSVAIYEKDPKAITTYNTGMYNPDYPKEWSDFFVDSLKIIAKEVLDWSELGDQAKMYSEKLFKLADVGYEKTVKCSRLKDSEFNVLNHGDCWINNMLFRYNDDGRVFKHIFVDFQLSLWNSPAIDLQHFLNTSIAESVELGYQDAIIKEYLSTLTRTMENIGCKTKPPTMQKLKRSLADHELYGVMSSLVMLPVVLLQKIDASSFDELMQPGSESAHSIYKEPAYRKIICRRLPKWNDRGLLDD